MDEETIYTAFKNAMKSAKLKGKEFYMNLRLILTGRTEGPELIDILEVLGKEETVARIRRFVGQEE